MNNLDKRIGTSRSGRRAAMARDGRLGKATAETVNMTGAEADALTDSIKAPIIECLSSKQQRAYEAVVKDPALAHDLLALVQGSLVYVLHVQPTWARADDLPPLVGALRAAIARMEAGGAS